MKKTIFNQIKQDNIPQHVAIIMDGNGRWAKMRNLPRTAGHKKGVDAVEAVLEAASNVGVKTLTLYAFSTENWKRPEEEITFIFQLPQFFYKRLLKKLQKWNVKIKWIGELDKLPEDMRQLIADFEHQTANHTGLLMYLAFNYGARAEITATARHLASQVKEGTLDVVDITETSFGQALYTGADVDVDLLIRTSGERRVSNFLLWQIAYSEMYFTDKLWPDFYQEDFYQAIYEYQQRDIRKGAVK